MVIAVGGTSSGFCGNFGAAVTVNVRVTGLAAEYVLFPPCEAVMEHVPAEIGVT